MNLSHIAADLRQQAHASGQAAKHKLPRGLALSYKRVERQCTLSAGRQDVLPSTEEALIIARAFGVPLGTEPSWTEKQGWYIVTWSWLEIEQAQQPALLPVSAAYH